MEKNTAKTAFVYHQHMGLNEQVVQKDGIYALEAETVLKTNWSNIIITNEFIVVDKKENKPFVRDIITKGLRLERNTLSYLSLNTLAIADDHKNQWLRCFDGR
jgi:hypothetical protein